MHRPVSHRTPEWKGRHSMDRTYEPEAAATRPLGAEQKTPRVAFVSRTSAPVIGCPLHFAMEQLARAAVAQHVLYAEGEYVARHDLIQSISVWTGFHEFMRTRVCQASRVSPMDVRQFDAQLDVMFAALPAPLAPETESRLRSMLVRCVRQGHGAGCPLDHQPEPGLLDQAADAPPPDDMRAAGAL